MIKLKKRVIQILLVLCIVSVGVFCIPSTMTTVEAAKVKLSKKSVTLKKGESIKLQLKGTKKKVKWKSSNKKVAIVNEKGKVTAKKAGTATITAKANGVTAKCKVTVKKQNGSAAANKLVPLNKLHRYHYFKKYMTDKQLKKTYNAAIKIVKPLKNLSKKEQLVGIAIALRDMYENGMSYSMSSAHYDDPYGYLILKKASCAGCARTTGFCLNILGIKYEHVQENQYAHQWARVKVGKEYWICDAYGLYCGPEPAVGKHPYFR